MSKQKSLLTIFSFFCILFYAKGQNHTIDEQGSYTTCSTVLYDSDSVGFYQDGETYTITFCSDGSSQSNSVNVGFGTLFKIDPSDTLFIYDGNSTAAPLIGAYNNNNPPVGVSSTTANTSGCLTFHFVSDGAVADSGWAAIINCVKVCQPIDPIITTTPTLVNYGPDSTYTNICPGDTVLFSASGAYPHSGINPVNYTQNDANSTFEWSFGEGTELTSQTGSASYNEGGYAVLLTVTDANNCQEQVIHKVRTGLTPSFSDIYALPDTACFGDTIQLNGGFNPLTNSGTGFTPSTGAITAGGTVTGQTFLPDGSGNSYTTSVGITGFAGQSINVATDIMEVCLNMEHSYNGDLDITLTCPNGQTMDLFDGSGGAVMGEPVAQDLPVDANSTNTDPGIGYDYCFNPTTTNGLPTDNIIPIATYTDVQGNTSTNIEQIPGGDYEAEGNWTDLIGCPIDGNWTITVTDNLSADNGYIFEWGLTLNPTINPNAEFYNVSINDGFWQSSPDIFATTDSMSFAAPQTEGDNQYTFQIIDEYGCDFDTTIHVFVLQELNAVATPDTTICAGQTVVLNVGGFVPNCDYTVSLYDSWGDGWNTTAEVDIYINGVLYLGNLTVPDCNGIECEEIITLPVTTGDVIAFNYTTGSFNNENTITVYDSDGNEVFMVNNPPDGPQGNIVVNCSGGYEFSWGPTSNLSDPNIPTPEFNGLNTQSYAVSMFLSNYPQCSVLSDSITIQVDSQDLPIITGDSAICFGEPVSFSVAGADSVLWPDNSNGNTYTFSPQNDSIIAVTASTTCGSITWNKHIVVYPELNITASPDSVVCEGNPVQLMVNGILNECTYLLTLVDSGGNGWNGFETIDVKINGITYQSGVSVPNCNNAVCYYSIVIPINEGDVITLEYNVGATDNENTVLLYDASNAEVFNVTTPTAGVIGTFNATCSNAYNIAWTPGSQLSDPSMADPIFASISSQNYQASVEIVANPNCMANTNTIALDVRSIENPEITGDTTLCIGETISLSINADSVLWWGDSTYVNTSFSFTPLTDTLITATASTFCVSNAVVNHFVEVYPLPTITTIPDTTIVIQESIVLTTTGGVIYYWTPDSYLSCNNCPDPEASPTETTTYMVQVTDSNGCSSNKLVTVEVRIPDLFIPTGFSPNNDGVNDEVLVRSLSIATMNLQIYDRWGGLVFETDNQERGWDGTAKGRKLDAGVYVYKFRARLVSGEKIEQAGNITLFR